MESGAQNSLGPMSAGQPTFDFVTKTVGCTTGDKLACLRKVPYAALTNAIALTPGLFAYQSLNLAWLPRVDGDFFEENPQVLVQKGKYSKIPIINGNCDDEGTFFSLVQSNITTDAQAVEYFNKNYYPKATPAEIAQIAQLYPSTPSAGSPYDTGDRNTLTPQFKRIASFSGDLVFQAARRRFMSVASATQNSWSYSESHFL